MQISALPRLSRHKALGFVNPMMKRRSWPRAQKVLDRLAVSQEPGLTNAQLMLTNHDLKPGECLVKERKSRQG